MVAGGLVSSLVYRRRKRLLQEKRDSLAGDRNVFATLPVDGVATTSDNEDVEVTSNPRFSKPSIGMTHQNPLQGHLVNECKS